MTPPPFHGGQGRSARDIEQAGAAMLFTYLVLAAVLATVLLC
jgi:hypothetical protein